MGNTCQLRVKPSETEEKNYNRNIAIAAVFNLIAFMASFSSLQRLHKLKRKATAC